MGYKYQHGRLVSNPEWRFTGTHVVWPWEWILRFQSPGKAHLHKSIFLIALASYYLHSCLVRSLVKNLPVMQEMQETQVWSMGQEEPLEEEMQPIPVFLPGKSHGQRAQRATVRGVAKSRTQLSDWTKAAISSWSMHGFTEGLHKNVCFHLQEDWVLSEPLVSPQHRLQSSW